MDTKPEPVAPDVPAEMTKPLALVPLVQAPLPLNEHKARAPARRPLIAFGLSRKPMGRVPVNKKFSKVVPAGPFGSSISTDTGPLHAKRLRNEQADSATGREPDHNHPVKRARTAPQPPSATAGCYPPVFHPQQTVNLANVRGPEEQQIYVDPCTSAQEMDTIVDDFA